MPNDFEEKIKKGIYLLNNKDFDNALQEFHEAFLLDLETPEAVNFIIETLTKIENNTTGTTEYLQGERHYLEAEQHFLRRIKLVETNANNNDIDAQHATALLKFEKALKIFEQCYKTHHNGRMIQHIIKTLAKIGLLTNEEEISEKFFYYAREMDGIPIDNEVLNIEFYPKQSFNGSAELNNLRKTINNTTDEEIRVAANLIGINVCNANRYFEPSPYHQFSIEESETYHRSAKNPLSMFLPGHVRYDPKSIKGADISHIGHYQNPHDVLTDYTGNATTQQLEPNAPFVYPETTPSLYDALLEYKKSICNHIANTFKAPFDGLIKVEFYNQYPCIMVFLKPISAVFQPHTSKKAALTAWTEIVMSYFLGLVNFDAKVNGLDIELTRRSSFSFLTPTLDECEQSFRISVGIIPKRYSDVLIQSLTTLNGMLSSLTPDDDLRPIFTNKNKLIKNNYSHNNFASQVFKELDGYYEKDKQISTAQYKEIFKNTLIAFDDRKILNKPVPTKEYPNPTTFVIDDEYFFVIVKKMLTSFENTYHALLTVIPDAYHPSLREVYELTQTSHLNKSDNYQILEVLKTFVQEKSISHIYLRETSIMEGGCPTPAQLYTNNNLYYYLETLNEMFYAMAIISAKVKQKNNEGYGSDSETEQENEQHKKIYAKKIIVQNGMRSILAALVASQTVFKCTTLYLQDMYYETKIGVGLLSRYTDGTLSFDFKYKLDDASIFLHDANACVTDGVASAAATITDNITILIIDTTSATTEQHHAWVIEFKSRPNMVALFFVSSGLKNEQMGADKNPYGTVRIFTKDKNHLTACIDEIRNTEKPVKSLVAHNYRRIMKLSGNTPRNIHMITNKPKI